MDIARALTPLTGIVASVEVTGRLPSRCARVIGSPPSVSYDFKNLSCVLRNASDAIDLRFLVCPNCDMLGFDVKTGLSSRVAKLPNICEAGFKLCEDYVPCSGGLPGAFSFAA